LANDIIHVQFGEVFKFNKQSDGSLQIFGKATDDTLDGDLQKCDLAWSAKAMEKWLATGGNMRVQHNPSLYPAGVGMSIDTKPDGVYLMAEIAEATAIRLVEKGALRAFSVGISRPKFARDASAPNGRIVGGDIVEVSLVDRPSNPQCAFTVKMAGKGDEAHFEGEYTLLPEVSSELNKVMNGTDLLTKGKDDGDDPDDSGDDVDESSAGDGADNGDGGKDQPADSDADGKPDSEESDTHSDDGKDKSDKEAEADVTKQDFDGDTDGGTDSTDPADTPDDGDAVDTDGDAPCPPADDGPDDGGSTETSTDDSMVDEIVEELVAEVGGGDGAEALDDADNLDVENKSVTMGELLTSISKQLQTIHDAVVAVAAQPVVKEAVPDLTKAVTVDDRINEITTAFDAERTIMMEKIEKLSAAPDFTLLNTPRRRATGSNSGGVDLAKGLTVTDVNEAAQEQERQARINWYSDLSKSGATRAEREAATELLGKLQFPDLTK
jgi:hypothetical protein